MILKTREGRAPGIDGTGLFWRLWTPPDPWASLFLIHGLGEHSGRYEELALWMGQGGVSLFGFDLRGHGRSRGARGDVSAFHLFLEDTLLMEGILDQVLGQEGLAPERRWILGHSLGGLIVLRTIQTSSVLFNRYDGGILSAPWLATPLPPWLRAIGRFLGRRLPGIPLPNGLGPHRLTRDPEKARERKDDPLVHARLTGRLFWEAECVQRECLNQGERLRDFPLLFMVPERDRVVSGDAVLEFVRGIGDDAHRIEILRDREHEPLNDLGRGEVFRLLLSWMQDLNPRPGDGNDEPERKPVNQ